MPFILSCYGWLRSGRITNGNVENIGQFFSQDLQPQIFRRLEFIEFFNPHLSFDVPGHERRARTRCRSRASWTKGNVSKFSNPIMILINFAAR